MEYVSKVTLSVNGQDISDFDSVEEKELELYKPVNLMNKTGHFKTTPRYGLSLEYVLPTAGEFDFTKVANGTVQIKRENGTTTTYSGVYVTKIGSMKYGEDNAAKRSIEFSAEKKG